MVFEPDRRFEDRYSAVRAGCSPTEKFSEWERYVVKLAAAPADPDNAGHISSVLCELRKEAAGHRGDFLRLFLSLLVSDNWVVREHAARQFGNLSNHAGSSLVGEIRTHASYIEKALENAGLVQGQIDYFLSVALNQLPIVEAGIVSRVRSLMIRLSQDRFDSKSQASIQFAGYLAQVGDESDCALIENVLARDPCFEVSSLLRDALNRMRSRLRDVAGCQLALTPFDQVSLVTSLASADRQLRRDAVVQLGLRGSREVVPLLCDALERETDLDVKLEILKSLGLHGSHSRRVVPRILKVLTPFVEAHDERVQGFFLAELRNICGVDRSNVESVLDYAKMASCQEFRTLCGLCFMEHLLSDTIDPFNKRAEDPNEKYRDWLQNAFFAGTGHSLKQVKKSD
jgi:HEAT repeat protein